MEHSKTLFDLIPFVNRLPNHSVTATFSAIILLIAALLFYKNYRRKSCPENPSSKFSLFTLFEIIGEWIDSLLGEVIGDAGRKFLPIIGTLFLFIFVSNFLGLIPGFLPPTANVNTNAALAIFVFFIYNYYGIREHGLKYLKQFVGPFWWLAILFVPIELISHLARPMSLSIRLFANIMGDHVVLGIFSSLVPLIVPIPFIALGLFVSFFQALIFSMLTIFYLRLAISHDH